MVIIEFLRKLFDAFRHVFTGGKSTKRRAQRRAARPPAKCPTCHQPTRPRRWEEEYGIGVHDVDEQCQHDHHDPADTGR